MAKDEARAEELAAEARLQKEALATLGKIGAPYALLRKTADEYTRLVGEWHMAKYGRPAKRLPKIRIG